MLTIVGMPKKFRNSKSLRYFVLVQYSTVIKVIHVLTGLSCLPYLRALIGLNPERHPSIFFNLRDSFVIFYLQLLIIEY